MIRVEPTVYTLYIDDVDQGQEEGVLIFSDEDPDERLVLPSEVWQAFRAGIKNGDFDDI